MSTVPPTNGSQKGSEESTTQQSVFKKYKSIILSFLARCKSFFTKCKSIILSFLARCKSFFTKCKSFILSFLARCKSFFTKCKSFILDSLTKCKSFILSFLARCKSFFTKCKSFILAYVIPTIVWAGFAIGICCYCCLGRFDINSIEVSPIITFTGFINAFVIATNKVIQEAANHVRHGIQIALIGGRAKKCNKLILHILVLMVLSIFCAAFSNTTFPQNANSDTGKSNYSAMCEGINAKTAADNRDGNMDDTTDTSDVPDVATTAVDDKAAAVSSGTLNESGTTGGDILSQEELRNANDGSTNGYGNPENQTANGSSTTDGGAAAIEISVFKHALLAIWLLNVLFVSWLIAKTYELQPNKISDASCFNFLRLNLRRKIRNLGDCLKTWGEGITSNKNKALESSEKMPKGVILDELAFSLSVIFGIKEKTLHRLHGIADGMQCLVRKQAELSDNVLDTFDRERKLNKVEIESIPRRTVDNINKFFGSGSDSAKMSIFNLCLEILTYDIKRNIFENKQPIMSDFPKFVNALLGEKSLKEEHAIIVARFYLFLASITKNAGLLVDEKRSFIYAIEKWFPEKMQMPKSCFKTGEDLDHNALSDSIKSIDINAMFFGMEKESEYEMCYAYKCILWESSLGYSFT